MNMIQKNLIKKSAKLDIADLKWILHESSNCLSCFEPPCQQNCPAEIPIPEFIRSLQSGNVGYAAKIIRDANPLAAICGAVCPEEVFCQSQCTRGKMDNPIRIRELHSFATSQEGYIPPVSASSDAKVAIIGAGPAGLACATKLAEKGIKSVVYEKSKRIGGVPSSSIPEFRLSDEIISLDIEYTKRFGIEFRLNTKIDDPEELFDEFDAIFIATGLAQPVETQIPNSNLSQVIPSLDFLEKARASNINEIKTKRVVIVGGGNVSLDVAASAMEHGASEVILLYRRGLAEMRVWQSELDAAFKRSVVISYLTAPVRYIEESGRLTGVECIRTRLTSERDTSGRRKPESIPGTEFVIPADIVIEAIGLNSDYKREITAFPDYTTSIQGIFSGGDWAKGEGTIVEAVRDGKSAAEAICNYLRVKKI
ncbi:MAG: NAD(P)-binding protein [candidate division Zixibacteria bacterium]|nr:NAD(P)-binding protein [candidate division Zixibacteria bacterium]